MCINSLRILIILLSLLKTFTITTPFKPRHDQYNLRSMHFTLYFRDYYNITSFMILDGIGGPPLTETTGPLGSIFVLNDVLTTTPNQNSDQIGTMEMMIVTHTTDGTKGIGVTKVNLNLKSGHKGSISLVGVTPYTQAPGDCSVSGGTGDFLFVQGYVTSTILSYDNLNTNFKYEFHLFWPPYAPFN